MANNDQSIHPRVVNGRTAYAKSNTCIGTGINRKAQKRLGARRLAHAATINSLKSGDSPLAYKTPGSMKKS